MFGQETIYYVNDYNFKLFHGYAPSIRKGLVYPILKFVCPDTQYTKLSYYNNSIHQNLAAMKGEHVGLKLKSYYFSKVLGAGAWATVYEVLDEKTKLICACKVIPSRLMQETPKLKELVQTEITVLQKCKSDNVIKYIDSFSDSKNIFIFTEFCNGGDMENHLKSKGRLAEDEAVEFLKQILNGFKGLHEVGALHRDFKTANVLLHNKVAKIADLGFAKILKNKALTGTILGTSVTMAPELLENRSYGPECDIWSVGVVYYQMLVGDYPYNAINDIEILKKIKSRRPVFPNNIVISDDSKDFINKCLTVDPKARISWKAIYEHPLFAEKKDKLRNTNVGNLASRIHMGNNKDFYNKQPVKVYPDFEDIMENPNLKKNTFQFQKANLEEAKDLAKIQQEIERKKVIEANILEISSRYLERRNMIMLAFKYGVAPIYELQQIPLNQNLYGYLICKKAYIEMRQLRRSVVQKVNIFKISNYWNQFLADGAYKRIIEHLQQDMGMLEAYIQMMKFEVQTNNSKIHNELAKGLDLTSNFPVIFKEQLNSYAFLLYDYKDRPAVKKGVLMKLIRFVLDYLEGIKMSPQHYDKRIEQTDFGEIDAEFIKKMSAWQ